MKQKTKISFLPVAIVSALVLSLSVANCHGHKKGGHGPHWSYEGDNGPAKWGELSSDFSACSEGKKQSPIDLKNATKKSLSKITFNYKSVPVEILNNGHTIQVNYAPGSTMTVDGVTYDLLQFHFHAKSEHTVDGKHYPGEVHLVHKNDKEGLAVLGIFLKGGGAEFAPMKAVFDNLPEKKSAPTKVNGNVNAAEFLPAGAKTWRYSGSLTTPPCSEGVKWHVMDTPISLSSAQWKKYTEIFDNNYRPVLPLNDRTLYLDK